MNKKACDYFYPNLTIAEAQEEALLCLQGMFEMVPPEERETIVKRVFEKVNFLPTSPHRGTAIDQYLCSPPVELAAPKRFAYPNGSR